MHLASLPGDLLRLWGINHKLANSLLVTAVTAAVNTCSAEFLQRKCYFWPLLFCRFCLLLLFLTVQVSPRMHGCERHATISASRLLQHEPSEALFLSFSGHFPFFPRTQRVEKKKHNTGTLLRATPVLCCTKKKKSNKKRIVPI